MWATADVLRHVETVNVGLSTFAEALRAQGAQVVEVDWRPPAGGDGKALELLTSLWGAHGDRVAAGNAEAVARIEASVPRAVSVAPAADVVPGLREGLLPHSGPPIE